MKVLDAIDTKGITSEGVNELTTMVHDKMQNTFKELNSNVQLFKIKLN